MSTDKITETIAITKNHNEITLVIRAFWLC